MTLYEKAKELGYEDDPNFAVTFHGCPHHYPELNAEHDRELCMEPNPCAECWAREYVEPEAKDTTIMTSERFDNVTREQIQRSTDVLLNKAKEYATDDRLHNFKVAAALQGCSPKQALAGMMAKHTVSVYDMCMSGETYSVELWHEKITDHINYLLLLNAMVAEEAGVAI